MNTRLIVPLLCIGALAFACGPRPHNEASATARARAVAQTSTVKRTPGRHDGEVATNLVVLRDGDGLRFAMQVANAGAKSIELAFPDGQTHDIVVVDSIGRPLWRWSEGRMFTQAMRNSALSGGDTLRIAETWERPTGHGTLTAIATLRSTNYPVERRVAFVLP